ncbi:MAG: hypothetical protein LBL46_01805 [Rickettsiales bacterium]|jgi:hypothetical protein|nr:hypothetical protein [Rickettsiales bacterium]
MKKRTDNREQRKENRRKRIILFSVICSLFSPLAPQAQAAKLCRLARGGASINSSRYYFNGTNGGTWVAGNGCGDLDTGSDDPNVSCSQVFMKGETLCSETPASLVQNRSNIPTWDAPSTTLGDNCWCRMTYPVKGYWVPWAAGMGCATCARDCPGWMVNDSRLLNFLATPF